jgi:hypothetical protein
MIINKVYGFILYVIAFFGLWNMADFLYTVLIAGKTYQFTMTSDGVLPVSLALVTGYLFILRHNPD